MDTVVTIISIIVTVIAIIWSINKEKRHKGSNKQANTAVGNAMQIFGSKIDNLNVTNPQVKIEFSSEDIKKLMENLQLAYSTTASSISISGAMGKKKDTEEKKE